MKITENRDSDQSSVTNLSEDPLTLTQQLTYLLPHRPPLTEDLQTKTLPGLTPSHVLLECDHTPLFVIPPRMEDVIWCKPCGGYKMVVSAQPRMACNPEDEDDDFFI